MTDTTINIRVQNDCLLIEKVINRVETITLTDKDLAKKFIGVWDASVEGKVFIVRNDDKYQAVSCASLSTWPTWEDDTILKVLRKFESNCKIFVFDASEELIKWLAE